MKNDKFDYQSIHNAIQELIKAGKETDRRIAETNKVVTRTSKSIDKLKDQTDKTSKEVANTSKSIDKLKDLVGGMGNNQGLAAEEEFFNSFVKTMRLGNIEFHSIDRNLRRHTNGIQDEFDIVLTNSDLIMIIEVKFKFHCKDVKKVLTKVANFKKLFPQYQNYKIYGAIAGKILSPKTIETAKKMNLFVVAQEGSDLKLLNVP